MNLEFHPDAALEARAAVDWYRARSERAADLLIAEIELATNRIRQSPTRFPRHTSGTRRYLLRRFPFLVIYRIPKTPDAAILVLAVAHGRRRPHYWKERA